MANRYFTLVNLLLVTLLIYFGVSLFYAVLSSGWQGAPPAVPSGRPETAAGEHAVSRLADYQVIVERNLFNSGRQALAGAQKTSAPELDVDKLKRTSLNLSLDATSGLLDIYPYAYITDQKTRETRIYRLGDTVQGATIKKIIDEKVVLNFNGRDEVLVQEPLGFAKTSAPGGARADAGAAPRPAAPEPIQQVTVKEEQIEKAMESLSDLMSQATFRPHLEDGQPAGISITGIKPNAVFRKLRLRNGDVITGVNGQAIASVDDAMKVFGTLSTDAPIQVKIKRRGQEETLEYKIE
jgi:general secretion pathway protein C